MRQKQMLREEVKAHAKTREDSGVSLRTRTRTNTNPNSTEASAADRSVRACDGVSLSQLYIPLALWRPKVESGSTPRKPAVSLVTGLQAIMKCDCLARIIALIRPATQTRLLRRLHELRRNRWLGIARRRRRRRLRQRPAKKEAR